MLQRFNKSPRNVWMQMHCLYFLYYVSFSLKYREKWANGEKSSVSTAFVSCNVKRVGYIHYIVIVRCKSNQKDNNNNVCHCRLESYTFTFILTSFAVTDTGQRERTNSTFPRHMHMNLEYACISCILLPM